MQSLQKDNSWKKTELPCGEFITHQKRQDWLYVPRMGRKEGYAVLHTVEDTKSLTEIMEKISTDYEVCWIRP